MPGDDVKVDVVGERLLRRVEAEDRAAPIQVGCIDGHPAIESTGAQQRRVQDIGAVGRGDHDHGAIGIEAVHLHQQLVERLLALLVGAHLGATALAPQGIDLIEKEDAGRVLLGVTKQISNARGADANEHLDEVRAAQREVGNARFAGDCPREQGLPGAGWANQEDPARHPGPELPKTLGRFEKLDDFLQLAFRLVDAHDLRKRHRLTVAGARLGEVLGHRSHRIAQQIRAPQHDDEQCHQHEQSEEVRQHRGEGRLIG